MVKLIQRVLLSFGLAADDHKRRIDMIDGHYVPIHESVLKEGPNVLVFLELLQRTRPPGEQPLTHLSPYLQLGLLTQRTRIELNRMVVGHLFYLEYKDD